LWINLRRRIEAQAEVPQEGPARFRNSTGEETVTTLSPSEIALHLSSLPGWEVAYGELVRTFSFRDFRAALHFVNGVGELAEAAGHHPDIDIRYNKVRLVLITHDTGNLTVRDFELAASISELC
jgi:4a-hydroxytetrahydrobiopterin dehydratase